MYTYKIDVLTNCYFLIFYFLRKSKKNSSDSDESEDSMDYSGSSASSRSSSEEDDVEPVVLAKDERRKSTFVRMKEASRDLPGKPKQKNKKHNFLHICNINIYIFFFVSIILYTCILRCFLFFFIFYFTQKPKTNFFSLLLFIYF